MAGDITLTIIKPDAVEKGAIGPILAQINESGFRIPAMKLMRLSRLKAGQFYAVHKDRPFYNSLVEFMSSGRIVAAILRQDNAVELFRKLIGATDPANAEKGTIRRLWAESIERNAIHGSDSDENAIIEARFFFSELERF